MTMTSAAERSATDKGPLAGGALAGFVVAL
jgi:hypothetical protein